MQNAQCTMRMCGGASGERRKYYQKPPRARKRGRDLPTMNGVNGVNEFLIPLLRPVRDEDAKVAKGGPDAGACDPRAAWAAAGPSAIRGRLPGT